MPTRFTPLPDHPPHSPYNFRKTNVPTRGFRLPSNTKRVGNKCPPYPAENRFWCSGCPRTTRNPVPRRVGIYAHALPPAQPRAPPIIKFPQNGCSHTQIQAAFKHQTRGQQVPTLPCRKPVLVFRLPSDNTKRLPRRVGIYAHALHPSCPNARPFTIKFP